MRSCLLLPLVWLLLPSSALRADDPRYIGVFADGSRVTGGTLHDWRERDQQPRLNDRRLFDAGNPIRWLRLENAAAPGTPTAFVEMAGGDRLPGRVVGFSAEGAGEEGGAPAHLLVEPELPIDPPEGPARSQLRVLLPAVRRIVFERRENDRYEPGRLFYRDGRRVAFRSLRFTAQGVLLLVENERIAVSFGEMAELHLPRADFWDAWFDQLAILTPAGDSRLVRLETLDGLRATVSLERLIAGQRGGEPDKVYHCVQPAWLLSPLWIQQVRIYHRQFFLPQEMPLSLVEIDRALQRSALGGGWRPQVDRNVQGGPLEAAKNPYGWGFGVQATTTLEFELPAIARSLHTRIALDQVVGTGGCAKAKIYLSQAEGQPLFETEHLIGSEKIVDSGVLTLAPAGQSRRLLLVADAADADRPAGADPLDIRDCVDWLEPLLTFDTAELQAELRRRTPQATPGLENWIWTPADAANLEFVNRWDDSRQGDRRFRLEFRPREAFVTFSRPLSCPPDKRWLLIYVSKHRDGGQATSSRVQVRLDGVARAEFETPLRSDQGPAIPLAVDVRDYPRGQFDVDVVLIGEGDKSFVEWGSIAFSDTCPGLLEVLEDAAPPIVLGVEPELTAEAPFSGQASLKAPAGQTVTFALGAGVPVRESPRLGEYRFVRFAWKKKAGKNLRLSMTAQRGPAARAGTGDLEAVYHAGEPQPVAPGVKAHRLGDRVPEEWTLFTRDLFLDFGRCTLGQMWLATDEAGDAWFDHIYFARTQRDFDRCPAPPSPGAPADANVLAVATEPAGYGRVLGDFAPRFSITAAGPGGLRLLNEFAGRARVLRTMPVDAGRPGVLRCPLDLSNSKAARLKLTVGRHPEGDWQLVVKAGGEQLHDGPINRDSAKDGWQDLEIDLARFAGKKTVLELQHRATGWSNEDAFWQKIEIVE